MIHCNLSLFNTDEGDIIIRDAQDILIPKKYRQNIVYELHSTHLANTSMTNLAKGKAYWPTFKVKYVSKMQSLNLPLITRSSLPHLNSCNLTRSSTSTIWR